MNDFEFERLVTNGTQPSGVSVPGCLCPDWQSTVPKLNAPLILASIRAGHNVYDGKPFVFCPWCGTKIPEPKITAGQHLQHRDSP